MTVAATLIAMPAAAELRPLDVPVTAGWKHAETGLILMPQIGGMSRIQIGDFGTEEADLAASYGNAEHTTGTIYVFHPGLDSVAVWFDRAQSAVLATKRYGAPTGRALPRAFAIEQSGPTNSLRITYAMAGGTLSATALAMVPVGDWLVAVRLSSRTMSAEMLDAAMSQVLHDIRWPAGPRTGPVAKPIDVCATPLRFRKAKVVKPDPTQMLINAILPAVAAEQAHKEGNAIATFCRDLAEPKAEWAVYRAGGATDRYMIALNDAGRAIEVAPALVIKGPPAYSVTMYDLTVVKTFPNVTAMLAPEQAVAMVADGAPVSATSTSGGDTRTAIDSNILPKKR